MGVGGTNRQQNKPPLQRDGPRAPRTGCAPQKAPDETRLGEIPAWVRTTCPNMHGQHLCTGFLRSQRKINHTRAHCVPERTPLNGKTKIKREEILTDKRQSAPRLGWGYEKLAQQHLVLSFAKQRACKEGTNKDKVEACDCCETRVFRSLIRFPGVKSSDVMIKR